MKKSMIKQCILSLLCLLWAGQTLLAGELRERVYLQTDKQFYLSGELVWMKFIATDLDQRLSDVSKVGYVELLDSASAVVQARLVLEKGVGWLSAVAFYLADRKLPAGGLYPLYAERGGGGLL